MHIEALVKYYHTHIRIKTKTKNINTQNFDKDQVLVRIWSDWSFHVFLVGMQRHSHWGKTVWQSIIKLNIHLACMIQQPYS